MHSNKWNQWFTAALEELIAAQTIRLAHDLSCFINAMTKCSKESEAFNKVRVNRATLIILISLLGYSYALSYLRMIKSPLFTYFS